MEFGHMRVTNDGQVISIWIKQPSGEGELFICSKKDKLE